jgi:hypothetical protein
MAQVEQILIVNDPEADTAKPSLPSKKIPRESWVFGKVN